MLKKIKVKIEIKYIPLNREKIFPFHSMYGMIIQIPIL